MGQVSLPNWYPVLLGSMMPSDDTSNLKEDSATAPNQKLNVGVVIEQVGVGFPYLNVSLIWFLKF